MILIDTSAWIDYFKGSGTLVEEVEELIESNLAAVCGPILTEVYRGVRLRKQRQELQELFKGLSLIPQPETLWEDAGILGAYVAKRGLNVRSFDLLIATYALVSDVELLTKDRDFLQMQKAGVPIRIYGKQR